MILRKAEHVLLLPDEYDDQPTSGVETNVGSRLLLDAAECIMSNHDGTDFLSKRHVLAVAVNKYDFVVLGFNGSGRRIRPGELGYCECSVNRQYRLTFRLSRVKKLGLT